MQRGVPSTRVGESMGARPGWRPGLGVASATDLSAQLVVDPVQSLGTKSCSVPDDGAN